MKRLFLFIIRFPLRLLHAPKNLLVFFHVWVWGIASFMVFLFIYLLHRIGHAILGWRFVPTFFRSFVMFPIDRLYGLITRPSRAEENTINRINLIDLAMRNMLFKKSRAVVTVGGMAIGIGAIVYLVSIGYGLQNVVTSRVARLDELQQTDVTTLPGSRERITDSTLTLFQSIPSVTKTLPLIASVAKVTVNNSVSDMAVYGVTADYLRESAIRPVDGAIFTSNELAIRVEEPSGDVAGITLTQAQIPERGAIIGQVLFAPDEDAWVRVRSSPEKNAPLLGYTRRTEGTALGTLLWGGYYPEATTVTPLDPSAELAPWLQASFPLWEKTSCSPEKNPECSIGGYLRKLDASGTQLFLAGFTALPSLAIVREDTREIPGDVLGETTDASASSGIAATADPGWVEIASESATAAKEKVKQIELPATAKKEAVVNRAMLKVLGISDQDAVGKTFTASFIITADLLENSEEKIESVPSEYKIVGVIPEERTPFFYVPFTDLRGLGVRNYSQVKVVVGDKTKLADARKQIENKGYSSRSVADTVKQIDSLFATARTVLAILGMVALSVAALGMFNTLTVSLLERTREVGLMKAMGMKSHEVQELFLTESMVMGFFGGILGIAIGFTAGKLTGVVISVISISRGAGYIDIAYLPATFTAFIFFLSLIVGVVTGIYPARRATKISALDALRYE